MKKKKVLIIGGGGKASSIAYAIIDASTIYHYKLEFCGYINDRDNVEDIEGYPVLGGLKDIPDLIKKNYYFINAIGKIGFQKERIELLESLQIPDDRFITFVHPKAYVAPNVVLGIGCVVMPNVYISSNNVIGKHTRIMANVFIGHQNIIGNYCFFSGSSCISASIIIKDGVFVNLNATVKELLTLDYYSTVGMGAVLTKSIGKNEIWIGNPAKLFNK